MTEHLGYYRSPTIHGDRVAFVCESDLWSVSTAGGSARRLTATTIDIHSPFFSTDGKHLAFRGYQEGSHEIYVMPASGGRPIRLTLMGAPCVVTGWSSDNQRVLFGSMAGQPFRRGYQQWSVAATGGAPVQNPIGPADRISHGPRGGVVIGRNVGDPARWKRYRGGTTGDLWIDRDGKGHFERLIRLDGNLANPMWIGDRICFLSDHEGHGNVYSCTPDGADLSRLTSHDDFYARNATSDGKRIVYQAGAELYVLDPASPDGTQKIKARVESSKPQLARRFADADDYLEDYELHPKGHSLSVVARGKLFTMPNWEQAVTQHGERDGVRYRLARFLQDGKQLVCVSDAGGEEKLERHPLKAPLVGTPTVRRYEDVEIGRPDEIHPSPTKNHIVVTNHRFELVWVDLKSGDSKILDTSEYGHINGVAWSPDGRWIAYGFPDSARTTHLKIVRVKTGETTDLTQPVHVDSDPCFDPSGKYLYFVSYRTFNPVYDHLYFDLGFPTGGGIYLLTLRKDVPSPFVPLPKTIDGKVAEDTDKETEDKKEDAKKKDTKKKDTKKKGKKKKDKKKKDEKEKKEKPETAKKDEKEKKEKPKKIKIDLDGIQHRVMAFPVAEGLYGHIEAIENKILYDRWPSEGSLGKDWLADDAPKGELLSYDLTTQKEETFTSGISGFTVALDGKTLIYSARKRVRVVKADAKPDSEETKVGRASGWIDLSRPRISVVPAAEWRQMYREAWRLQRDNFWNPNMSNIDWTEVYERYLPVLSRVATRTEFSDLMWEVQGELGTSHAYEFGGDHREADSHRPGLLGADLALEDKRWVVKHVVRGDSWVPGGDSPLNGPAIDVLAGDVILRIDGQELGANTTPGELLVERASAKVELVVQRGDGAPRAVTVKTLGSDVNARYREWVETNRAEVHAKSDGKLGYVHIPDMGPRGYSEFHRYYQLEIKRQGLIVDVRYNGGGHVSQLILEKLARKRIGYDVPRHGKPSPYPMDSVLGPIVGLTNEHAGSDGDIFSHCFKLLKLGPLIGKRTWGGVVGIWPRHPLVDQTITTQAEFAFWFEDVGWGVENRGTDPDIEVDIAPQHWAKGLDPQLEKALAVATRLLEETPPTLPDFGARPDRRAPRLSGP
jgi:tricorn protease